MALLVYIVLHARFANIFLEQKIIKHVMQAQQLLSLNNILFIDIIYDIIVYIYIYIYIYIIYIYI